MIIKEWTSPDAKTSAYALGAIIAVDKGIGNKIEQSGGNYTIVCDDGSRITIKQQGAAK